MALTKVQKTGITDNAIDADKIEDGTIVAADIAPGTITNAKLAGSIANDKLANSSITVNGTSVSLGGSVSAGKVQWQSVKTTDFNAVAGEGYFVDTDSVGAVTATLPGSPSAGDTIAIKDYAGTFGTNALTIARNGNNIQGVANDSEISTNRASIVLVYIDATKGWLYTNESNVGDLEAVAFISATGGTVTTSGDYKIHTFTGDGCFVVSCAGGVGAGPNTVDYLVIAGGGGGGFNMGGGGGAGGYRESSGAASGCYTASPLGACVAALPVSATTYPITVGAGGSGGTSNNDKGCSGSNSVFSTITSAGGGGGGARPSSPDTTLGIAGGSGGGNANDSPPANVNPAGNTPPVSPPQGQPGGFGRGNTGINKAGGGGGATAAGGDGSPGNVSGGGGAGATSSINGTPTARAGGGGGGTFLGNSWVVGPASPCGTGGIGGPNAANGTINTGGAGGGAGHPADGGTQNGGSGGKGIVIIRYKFQ
jgi:hypothetical protein